MDDSPSHKPTWLERLGALIMREPDASVDGVNPAVGVLIRGHVSLHIDFGIRPADNEP